MSCLPKWHTTKAPNFPIRTRFDTLHRHYWPGNETSGKWAGELEAKFEALVLFVLWVKMDFGTSICIRSDTLVGLSLLMKAL